MKKKEAIILILGACSGTAAVYRMVALPSSWIAVLVMSGLATFFLCHMHAYLMGRSMIAAFGRPLPADDLHRFERLVYFLIATFGLLGVLIVLATGTFFGGKPL